MSEIVYKKPKIVAEIGCNHMGSMDLAKELIELAKLSGGDYAKFQKRNPKESLTQDQYNAPHPDAWNSFGNTYGAHREFLEFSLEQHRELKAHCDKVGIGYATSVWDITSAKEIISLNPDFIKVPSACNTHLDMLRLLRDEYAGDVHISLGMTTRAEEEAVIKLFEEKNQAKRLVLYSCTSGYPVKFDDVSMLEIKRIIEAYGDRVKEVGFSGHHLGIAIDIAAFMLGATWIERHFTKDRTLKGTDHAASLEPYVFQKLGRDIVATLKSLTYKNQEILNVEEPQRKKLKYKNNLSPVLPRSKVIAFLAVKGNSKSIPSKNIKDFCGKPLVYWILKALSDSQNIDEIYVMTESEIVKNVVNSLQIKKVTVLDETQRQSADNPSTDDVLLEFLSKKNDLSNDDVLIFAQTTTPFTQTADIDGALKLYREKQADSLVSGVNIKRFFWSEAGQPINYNYKDRPRRQYFAGTFMENGAFYINRVGNMRRDKNRLSGKIVTYRMPDFAYVELDEPDDWWLAEKLMQKHILKIS